LLGFVAKERDKLTFGKCHSCTHLECEHRRKQNVLAYTCSYVNEPLEPSELDEICVNYEFRRH
jgi:hypothetical protein